MATSAYEAVQTSLPGIPDYTIKTALHVTARRAVYRAVQQSQQRPVVIKLLQAEQPSFGELIQFRNQYEIAKNLSIPGVVQPLSLEQVGNGYALVMPDDGSVSLADYSQGQPLDLTTVLGIAVQLADIFHHLHQHRVIHKDIKPANLLIHPESKQVKLIDFSISSLLPKETQEVQNPNTLEGTLPYLAPEQTGRMNRGIDYRADYYALGITLYQLLTGQLPFISDDPLELVHCHIAQLALPIHEILPEIPEPVGAIVAKLMAKNVEDRYQTALGLKHDLLHCLTQWKDNGAVAGLMLGQQDICDRFIIPEKLYGRQTEVDTLLAAFDRVADGAAELMLVAGVSGTGKTAVVNEVHKPIVRRRGYFAKGKFDQLNRNLPFSAFIQVFQGLIRQLLGESDAQLDRWKTQIAAALGENAQVIIDLIPELERILGPQPAAPELSGTAAQNRFNLLFQKFAQAFTTPEHPLVLFLDDLQWADSASLNLIQLLMDPSQTHHVLLLGAYRDNEVFPAHPLMVTLDDMSQAGATIDTITLQPLSELHLSDLIADTLNDPAVQPLTQLVMQKTQGNPFFATQFLKTLHQDQLIAFDRDAACWQWDIEQIQAAALTDDVVDFMAQRLRTLPTDTQEMLTLAACIGAQFDLETLSIVANRPETDVSMSLWQALQTGLVLPLNQVYHAHQGAEELQDDITVVLSDRADIPRYRFLHDRVQQAAYSLIAETQKAPTHWRIGQLLLQRFPDQEERLFDVVNQLNLGRSVTFAPEQILQLAQLNLQAAKKAKRAVAYRFAQTYCESGLTLLASTAWNTDYRLMYELHYHGAEAAYLSGDFETAESLYPVALKHAQSPLDQAVIYRVQMTQYQFQGRNADAIAIQRRSLDLLGWSVPAEAEQIQASLDTEIAAVNQFLEQQTIASILALPQMIDAHQQEMLRILQILFYAAWLDGQPTLALLALAKMTTLSLQNGNSEMSPFGYAGYGLIANIMLSDAASAYQFGHAAVQLCEAFDNADVRGMTNFLFAADVHSWNRPLREADTYYDNGYKYSMEAGNWLTVSFTMMLSGSDRLTYGKNLDELYEIVQAHAVFLKQVKSLENLDALTVGVLQPVRQLLGLTYANNSFDDEGFSEAAYLQKYQDVPYHLAWFYSVKIRHAYLFGQVETYADLIPKVDIIANTIPTHAKHSSTVFYVALMQLGLIEHNLKENKLENNAVKQDDRWQAVETLEAQLERWQQDCPENILHKCLLVRAEKARLTDQRAAAVNFYQKSITQAYAQGYEYEAALASELAVKACLSWGEVDAAKGYMQTALQGYRNWGAKAKVQALEDWSAQQTISMIESAAPSTSAKTTPLKPVETLLPQVSLGSITSTSSQAISSYLDLTTVLSASQMLSSEIELDKLLARLMDLALRNAGADRGMLLLPDQQSSWSIRATATLGSAVEVQRRPLSSCTDISHTLVNTVKHNAEPLVIDDATLHPMLLTEPYVIQQQPKSLLCTPIVRHDELTAVLYLENRLTSGAFTQDRVELLNFLCTQAAISLENARLYQQAQAYSQQLEQSQLQVVQNEKMASLGNLVAGVAHEINNPIGFLKGSVNNGKDYVEDLLAHLAMYQQQYPLPGEAIEDHADEIDLEFIREDLAKLLDAMDGATNRIRNISTSLRTFSRADREHKVEANLQDGLDSTLLILKYRLKANEQRPAIEVVQDYGELPLVNCFPGQLNQVFMNILANAIDVFDEMAQSQTYEALEANPQIITIQTRVAGAQVQVRLRDNGKGMDDDVKAKVFDHLFTTKAVGKGTGLGLAISRQIITETHGGSLTVESAVGQGTEFIIGLPM